MKERLKLNQIQRHYTRDIYLLRGYNQTIGQVMVIDDAITMRAERRGGADSGRSRIYIQCVEEPHMGIVSGKKGDSYFEARSSVNLNSVITVPLSIGDKDRGETLSYGGENYEIIYKGQDKQNKDILVFFLKTVYMLTHISNQGEFQAISLLKAGAIRRNISQ